MVISSADGHPDVGVVVETGRFAVAVTYVCYCQWRRWKSHRGHDPHATSAGHATAKRQDLVWSGSVREIVATLHDVANWLRPSHRQGVWNSKNGTHLTSTETTRLIRDGEMEGREFGGGGRG